MRNPKTTMKTHQNTKTLYRTYKHEELSFTIDNTTH